MGKKKKDTIELRFYEIPQNEYVLALLGENWIRDYGHDEVHLHFHNLMEIGVCRNGTGKLILDEEQRPYQPAMVSIIPNNYPHVTISNTKEGPSYWEYLFFDPAQIIAEMYPKNELFCRELIRKINRRALFLHEWENHNLAFLVRQIMEEMRGRRSHYTDSVRGLLYSLVIEIIRLNEEQEAKQEVQGVEMQKHLGVTQIAAALDYVRMEYMHMIRVEELAQECHMSETHFRRLFESCMNMSPVDYINLVRIQKACDLLKKTTDSMDIVAQKAFGVLSAELVKRRFKSRQNRDINIHWRQIVVLGEMVLVAIAALLPQSANAMVNIIISFVCAMQVETFRKVRGSAFATTMCTGNLRSGTEQLVIWRQTGDRGTYYRYI